MTNHPPTIGRYITKVPAGQRVWVGAVRLVMEWVPGENRATLVIEAPKEIKIIKEQVCRDG